MISLQNVSKKIGNRTILEDVSLTVEPGAFTAVFGPNGAGKSTLLRVMSLLTSPSGGTLFFRGRPITEEIVSYRRCIGVLSHRSYLYENLSAFENLQFYGRIFDVPQLEKRVDELLVKVGLELFRNDPVRAFSRGMQQRLAIARAILHKPELLLLDEPYTGLDQHAAEILEEVLRDFKGGGASAVIVSHDFDRGLTLADSYVVLHRGSVHAQGPASEIDADWLRECLRALGGGGR